MLIISFLISTQNCRKKLTKRNSLGRFPHDLSWDHRGRLCDVPLEGIGSLSSNKDSRISQVVIETEPGECKGPQRIWTMGCNQDVWRIVTIPNFRYQCIPPETLVLSREQEVTPMVLLNT